MHPLFRRLLSVAKPYDGTPRVRRKFSLSDDTYRRLQYAAFRASMPVSDVIEFFVQETIPTPNEKEDENVNS